ncbi:MAG TPA: tyrosine-type recombinase/integrase [Pirellulales bacterium]|jgi:integrase
MGRRSSPYYWKEKQAWYCTIDGARQRLGSHPEHTPPPRKKSGTWNVPEVIRDGFHALMSKKFSPVRSDSTWAILDAFLDWCHSNRPASYDWYKYQLQRFKNAVPNMRTDQLKPFHVQRWLDQQTWGDNYKRGVTTAIKRCFNFAVKAGYIPTSPVASLEKPAATHRDVVITAKQFQQILDLVTDEQFKDFLRFAWLTGVRPQEARLLEARHIDHVNKIAIFPPKESKGKKKSRVVHMVDAAYAIAKKWAKRNSEGPIFRNLRGTPWTAYSINCRFTRMEEELGFKPFAYAMRHSYIHNGLTKGKVDPVVMATLAGHADTTMIFKVYGHLLKDSKFMRKAANRAVDY